MFAAAVKDGEGCVAVSRRDGGLVFSVGAWASAVRPAELSYLARWIAGEYDWKDATITAEGGLVMFDRLEASSVLVRAWDDGTQDYAAIGFIHRYEAEELAKTARALAEAARCWPARRTGRGGWKPPASACA